MDRKTSPEPDRKEVAGSSRGASSCGRRRVRLWTLSEGRTMHRPLHGVPQDPVENSLEGLQKTAQYAVELLVPPAHCLDLADGVDDRRVMLATEGAADRRKRLVGELLAEEHRHLPR